MILLLMSLLTTVADLLIWGSTQKRSQNDLWLVEDVQLRTFMLLTSLKVVHYT